MKILLIYPPISAPIPAKSTLLGLGYLASTLRRRGHDVVIRDYVNGYQFDDNYYDAICITIMFSDYKNDAYKVIELERLNRLETHIIAGGAHSSTFPDEVIEHVDTVVVGEGEEIIGDIIENRKFGVYRAERIKDLDKLPFPAWDLLFADLKEINRRNKNSPFHMRKPIAPIITSRGCPNNCVFCAIKLTWGRQWIPRSAKNVVDEIEYLNEKFGIKEILFNDDNCSISKDRMYEICDEILKRKIKVKIACPTGIHIMTLDRPLLKRMKKAGFYRLCFGIETGSPELQIRLKKNINLIKARRVIQDANDLGFWTAATFIFDFPFETDKQIQETLDFVKTSGLDFPIFYNLNPQPKTEIYEECKRIL